MSYTVSLSRCPTYADVETALAVCLAPLGGIEQFVKPGERVLIKLNLLSAHPPEHAVTTHPALVKAVVRAVQGLGAEAVIGDSPGGINTPATFQSLLRVTGIQRVIEETGCGWLNFDEATAEIASERARVFKKLTVVRAPLDFATVIALPKLKTHQFAYMTGAVKLLYGYLPGLSKAEYHMHAGRQVANFAELLLDILETFPPTLTIMDAVTAMEGNGPAHGTPRQVGALLASANCPALDFAAAEMIGLSPMIVPTIRAAAMRGIGPQALEEITLAGDPLDTLRVPDFQQAATLPTGAVPPWAVTLSSWLFAARPVIDRKTCSKCGKCAAFCPAKAMNFHKGAPPKIDYAPCIRCYCCHELCPANAIRIAGPRVPFPMKLGEAVVKMANRKAEKGSG